MFEDSPPQNAPRSNIPELSVSELAFSLKKTLEDSYGHIRVRGELSRVKIHTSGHLYSDLKDENALINIVCWKGTLSRLSLKPEEGLEVVCTGRISTYPARSNYQMIVESMTLAGEGALLKMLEDRRKKLAAEGLFDPARKKKIPFLPGRIGVVTSPTGAVIRDILHRLSDRFPRHVLLWPVPVQGTGAAQAVAQAIEGFNALPHESRPDVLIVARGGGSLEDLMAFNEEIVVRAAAKSAIPLISAIGHETDTTLIDYAADLRAPTPTAAAEMAVPRRIDLLAQVAGSEQRLIDAMRRITLFFHEKTAGLAARLGNPEKLLEIKTQTLDHLFHKAQAGFERLTARKREKLIEQAGRLGRPERLIEARAQTATYLSHKLAAGFEREISRKREKLVALTGRLSHPSALLAEKGRGLAYHSAALARLGPRICEEKTRTLSHISRMLESLSYESILNRGFVVVRDENGRPLTDGDMTHTGQKITLQFRRNGKAKAVIE